MRKRGEERGFKEGEEGGREGEKEGRTLDAMAKRWRNEVFHGRVIKKKIMFLFLCGFYV